MGESDSKESCVNCSAPNQSCANDSAKGKDLIVLSVESPVQLLEGSGGTTEAVSNPWPELHLQEEPYVVAMEVFVPDSIYPLLSLLLHHSNCGAAVAVGQCHGPQNLFCMLDWFMIDGGVVTTQKWDSDFEFFL